MRSDLSVALRNTSSWWNLCPKPVMNVMLAGDVDPRSRIFNPSSREMARMNSLKPVERRLTFSPRTNSSSVPCRPELPNILLKMPGATAHHCMGSDVPHQQFTRAKALRCSLLPQELQLGSQVHCPSGAKRLSPENNAVSQGRCRVRTTTVCALRRAAPPLLHNRFDSRLGLPP